MKELFVSYEISLLLKEKGFNELCFAVYINGRWEPRYKSKNSTFNPNKFYKLDKRVPDIFCTAPTHQQIVDWMAINHELYITYIPKVIEEPERVVYIAKLYDASDDITELKLPNLKFYTIEKALLNAITEAIKLI